MTLKNTKEIHIFCNLLAIKIFFQVLQARSKSRTGNLWPPGRSLFKAELNSPHSAAVRGSVVYVPDVLGAGKTLLAAILLHDGRDAAYLLQDVGTV